MAYTNKPVGVTRKLPTMPKVAGAKPRFTTMPVKNKPMTGAKPSKGIMKPY